MDIDEPAPIVTGSAFVNTAASNPSVAPLESRIKPDSRDAFLERQRLKEMEEMKREKAEKAKREAEIKAKIEEEKRQRTSHTSASSDIDPEEAKRQFELKQRQKEAEEAKRKRQAEIEDKERIRREMEAEKQLRAAKMGITQSTSASSATHAQPSSAAGHSELSAAEKSKQEYLKEKKEEALARERLRKQIEEDKAKRFGAVRASDCSPSSDESSNFEFSLSQNQFRKWKRSRGKPNKRNLSSSTRVALVSGFQCSIVSRRWMLLVEFR